jgi:hypothetical protein
MHLYLKITKKISAKQNRFPSIIYFCREWILYRLKWTCLSMRIWFEHFLLFIETIINFSKYSNHRELTATISFLTRLGSFFYPTFVLRAIRRFLFEELEYSSFLYAMTTEQNHLVEETTPKETGTFIKKYYFRLYFSLVFSPFHVYRANYYLWSKFLNNYII